MEISSLTLIYPTFELHFPINIVVSIPQINSGAYSFYQKYIDSAAG